MKEQYTSPEVTLISYVAEEEITNYGEQFVNGGSLFESAAEVNVKEDIPFFFDWLS